MALNYGPVVIALDRVKTKTGRHGVVKGTSNRDTAHVVWDDGEEFPIRFCHLEVLAHGCMLPAWYYMKDRKSVV